MAFDRRKMKTAQQEDAEKEFKQRIAQRRLNSPHTSNVLLAAALAITASNSYPVVVNNKNGKNY